MYKSSQVSVFVPSGKGSKVEFLDHMEALFLIFLKPIYTVFHSAALEDEMVG